VVLSRVSVDGANVTLSDLAGLHQRSPLLAWTLLAGVFALAGLPPFAGFAGKLMLLTAAYAKGHLVLVILAVINSAIGIGYYLGVVREAFFREAGDRPRIEVDGGTRLVCLGLTAVVLLLGVWPGWLLRRYLEGLGGS
jgi:NADH-quinone oxidoreductase subunit N